MNQLYNHDVFLLFIGGVFSLVLTVAIVFLKQIHKRSIERKRLEEQKKFRPEEIGDIDAKLNDSTDFKNPNLFQELTLWGIQPLLIISFASLFSHSSEIEIIIAFSLIILTLFHEFHLADQFSKNGYYQWFILLLWVFVFFIISYKINQKQSISPNQTNKNTAVESNQLQKHPIKDTP